MGFLKNLGMFLLAFIAGLILAWVGLWAANIINFVISMPFGIVGMLFGELFDEGPLGLIYKFITFGLAYTICFHLAQALLTRKSGFFMTEAPWMTRLAVIVCAAILIIAGDEEALAPYLPEYISYGGEFCRYVCGFQILVPVDWLDIMDYGESQLDELDFFVYDLSIAISAIVTLFYNWWDNR